MGFTSWLKSQTKKGLVPDPVDDREMENQLSNYYGKYLDTGTYTTSSASSTLSEKDLKRLYKQMQTTGNYITNSTVSSGFTGTWNQWTKEEKKALAKVGFHYDKERNEWVLDLSTSIRIPQIEGFEALTMGGSNEKPSEQMITAMKQAKEALVEKLTAKIILAELTKPREIREDQ